MAKENWFERQLRESDKDLREIAIKAMFANIIVEKIPKVVMPIGDVPEFADDALLRGTIGKKVSQGYMGSTEDLPIRTDNAADCNIFLIKTPQDSGSDRYTMVHVWGGDLNQNRPGSNRQDIKALANEKSTAIGITGTNSMSINHTAREFKYDGITTVKHIDVPTGRRYVSAVYRPKTNDILIRIGADTDATEVWVFAGF